VQTTDPLMAVAAS